MKIQTNIPRVSLVVLVALNLVKGAHIGEKRPTANGQTSSSIEVETIAMAQVDEPRGRSRMLTQKQAQSKKGSKSKSKSRSRSNSSCKKDQDDYQECLCHHYPWLDQCNPRDYCYTHSDCQGNLYEKWCCEGQCRVDDTLCSAQWLLNPRFTCDTHEQCDLSNANFNYCCGGFCSPEDCPEDPIPACTEGGDECLDNANNRYCCPDTNTCLTKDDFENINICNPNPQITCSSDDNGAACLRNQDNRNCCGGECISDSTCPSCTQDSDCTQNGYVCCQSSGLCQLPEDDCACATTPVNGLICPTNQECCKNSFCQSVNEPCVGCTVGESNTCPGGELCCLVENNNGDDFTYCASTCADECQDNQDCSLDEPFCCGNTCSAAPCSCTVGDPCDTVFIQSASNTAGDVFTTRNQVRLIYETGLCCNNVALSLYEQTNFYGGDTSSNLCLRDNWCRRRSTADGGVCQIDGHCLNGCCVNSTCLTTAECGTARGTSGLLAQVSRQ